MTVREPGESLGSSPSPDTHDDRRPYTHTESDDMKFTFRIPTEIIGQVLSEGLGTDEPIKTTEPIVVEFDLPATEFVTIANAGWDILVRLGLIDDETDESTDDGTSPHTIPMNEEAA